MAPDFDHLRLFYYVILGMDPPRDISVFQGFSRGWRRVSWALDTLATLPADVLEPSFPIEAVTAQRIGGLRSLTWGPLSLDALEPRVIDELGIFVVLFSGDASVAEGVAHWAARQAHPSLHVSSVPIRGVCRVEEFSLDVLRNYCAQVLQQRPQEFTAEQLKEASIRLPKWTEPTITSSGLTAKRHNITYANYMSLERAARSREEGEAFVGASEQEYTEVILEAAQAVMSVRDDIGLQPFHFATGIRPGLILAEPALFRPRYKAVAPQGIFEEKAVARALRQIQTQRGLYHETSQHELDDIQKSPEARTVIVERRRELETFTAGIGLYAAQSVAAVVRLSPGVNHVFPALSNYARNVRSSKYQAQSKTRRLFETVQKRLAEAVGNARIDFIRRYSGPIKIISDAPIEWLPVGNLPLGIRYDCSRINATPGNLLMQTLTDTFPIVLPPEALRKILIVTCFADDDPLKDLLRGSLAAVGGDWANRVECVYRTAQTKAEFVDVLNSFDGAIMIFDGHGANNATEPIGKLMIGNEAIDVWDLRGHVRTPPIVILSACDTHGIDASSQATVGNGFLFLGAQTVLATLLPVGGRDSAMFVGRLILRIIDYPPAIMSEGIRVVTWTEIVGGMLRMLLASEVLNVLVGPPAPMGTPRARLQAQVNADLNIRGADDWYDRLLANIASETAQELALVEQKAHNVLTRSEAIRYIQLGNPENIVIHDGRPKNGFSFDDPADERSLGDTDHI